MQLGILVVLSAGIARTTEEHKERRGFCSRVIVKYYFGLYVHRDIMG